MLLQSFIERVRVLVGMKRWDYIVLWKLSNDERCIEWVDCCCGGSERVMEIINGDEDSTNLPCRDIMFPHPRFTSCHLLDQLPSSMLLDSSGVHAQALLSNQPTWLNITSSQDTIATRVLIPLSLGLLELFVTKHVPEDEEMVNFIRAQCNLFIEQQTMNSDSFSSDHQKDHHQLTTLYQQQQISCDLPNDISVERIHLCNSPLNSSFFMEESNMFLQESESNNMMSSSSKGGGRWMEPTDDQINDHSFMCEKNRSDDSDPNDEDDDIKCGSRRRGGKGPQSKNLEAERKRRKKLNDRLYALRSLVPNISKLDRASILGDAIEYVKELQKQAEDLKVELEEQSDDEENARKTPQDDTHETTKPGPKREHDNYLNGYHHKGSPNNEKVQLMEPQVEVFQLDGNDFFVKVFCEHKSGGFVRLMEALNSLGLEVANVNTTRHTCLVSTIFKVERKNDETVDADDVKESLLELTRNPSQIWHTNPNNEESESQNMDNDFSIDHNHTHIHCRQINPHHHQR